MSKNNVRLEEGSGDGYVCDLCADTGIIICYAEKDSYVCTKPEGHTGDHTACSHKAGEDSHPIITWKQEKAHGKNN